MLNLEQFGGVLVPAGFGLKFLLDLILLAFVVIPVAACLDLLVRRKSSAARHHVWLLAMIALLAAPVLSLLLPNWNFGPSVAVAAPASELPLEAGQAADSQSKQVNA